MTVTPPENPGPVTVAERLIDRWHDLPEDSDDFATELHEYLRLTWEEYQAVVLHPAQLDALVRERNPGFATYIEARLASQVGTLQEALGTLESEERPDGSFWYSGGQWEAFLLSDNYCTIRLADLQEALTRLTDEGWDFDEFHNVRLWVASYEIILNEIRTRAGVES